MWTTDKDGLVPALLSAEITARQGKDPGELYAQLTRELGEPVSDRIEAAATPAQKASLAKLSPSQLHGDQLAGEKIAQVLDQPPGTHAAIGGIKAIAARGRVATRPSGTARR